ncbi:hypothetical protein LINGRAHAP2_LOCUS33886 [Linum grandiflorum]
MAGKTTSATKKTADLLDSDDDDDLFKTKRLKTLVENPSLQSPPPQEIAGPSIKTTADLLDSDDDDDLFKTKRLKTLNRNPLSPISAAKRNPRSIDLGDQEDFRPPQHHRRSPPL